MYGQVVRPGTSSAPNDVQSIPVRQTKRQVLSRLMILIKAAMWIQSHFCPALGKKQKLNALRNARVSEEDSMVCEGGQEMVTKHQRMFVWFEIF